MNVFFALLITFVSLVLSLGSKKDLGTKSNVYGSNACNLSKIEASYRLLAPASTPGNLFKIML